MPEKRVKKLLIFSLAYVPHVGGAEIAIKEITDRITDVQFHMLTLRFEGEPRTERVGNVVVHRIGNGNSFFSKVFFVPRAASAAGVLHRTHQFDVFWSMMSYMLFPVALLRLFGNRTPYVLTLQEGDPWEHTFRRWFIRPLTPLLRRSFREASAITVISNYLAGWAKRMEYKGEVHVIPNGVDVAHFAYASTQSQVPRLRDALGKKVGDIFLVTTSRLVQKNGIDSVIRAMPLLSSRISFIIYGIGPDEEKLRSLAAELGVEDRVRFMGHVGHEEMPFLLKTCDIFIRPSRSEGMGNSFIEAMAAGLPVIATQEGGIADFLFDKRRNPELETTGWAVPVDAPQEIARAVDEILAHPQDTARVVASARRLATESYDWTQIARRMRTVFEQVSEKR